MSMEWHIPEPVPVDESDPRIQTALAELQDLIRHHYPEVRFTVSRGEDPEGIYLKPEVDVADLDEVAAVFTDRLVDMQVEEGLPIYVIPIWPLARVTAYLQQRAAQPIEVLLPVPATP